jgi:hypothetical protein
MKNLSGIFEEIGSIPITPLKKVIKKLLLDVKESSTV